jgi:hypothetical protein
MKCDRYGITIEGGRRKLNQHKKERHSYLSDNIRVWLPLWLVLIRFS